MQGGTPDTPKQTTTDEVRIQIAGLVRGPTSEFIDSVWLFWRSRIFVGLA
jgi:hypothetical protein